MKEERLQDSKITRSFLTLTHIKENNDNKKSLKIFHQVVCFTKETKNKTEQTETERRQNRTKQNRTITKDIAPG